MRKFHFTHRPPTTGVHLLSDPFPAFDNPEAASRLTEKHLEMLKEQITAKKPKKSRSQT